MACYQYAFDSLEAASSFIERIKKRSAPGQDPAGDVRAMLEDVRARGDAALVDYTRKFDCPSFGSVLRVTDKEAERAMAKVSTADLRIITDAAANIRHFHEEQKDRSWFMTRQDGSIFGQRILPVDSAGLYVPGGKGGSTPLISSLLMQAIPAQVAGVRRVALVSPPSEDGSLNPYLLAAAYLLDITEIYKVGGPWAIGALAYGTQSILPVEVITGPGNVFVTEAKRQVRDVVGIDMLAGPSEILVLADASANADYIVADMLSQAEHDRLASAVLIATDRFVAEKVAKGLDEALETLPRRDIAGKSLEDWGAVITVKTMKLALEIANAIAPEHMELLVRSPWNIMPQVKNAGAVFLGPWSPEPVGDYFAGPNHVLPTQGTARFASALSVQTFCKRTSILSASEEFTKTNAGAIASLARLEGLEAHARSVLLRSEIG